MKIILSFLLIISLFACNSNTENKTGPGNSDTSSAIEQKQEVIETKEPVAGACGKLIFFQPGAEVEATSYNENGEVVSKQLTKILSVINEGGFTVANVEGVDTEAGGENKSTTVHYSYKCDGNKIYFDIASMFRTAEKEKDATFEASVIEYPINIKEGVVLPDAAGKMSSEKDGKKMNMSFIYKDRKVEAKEDVTTAAGTWSCYKISNTTEVEMDIPGMDEKTKEMMKKMQAGMKNTTATWFSPDFGIVKMEMYTNGKLVSRNEVTAVKK